MLRDAVIVGPVLIAGAVSLMGAYEASWRNQSNLPFFLLFLAFLFGILLVWHRGKLRSAERSRHFEPDGGAGWVPARAVVAVGAGVPLGSLALAWLASVSNHTETSAIWGFASAVGITGLICGTYLLARVPGSLFSAHPRHAFDRKPAEYDPDAFDVVGRRG